jgi:RNase P subunit RPR2
MIWVTFYDLCLLASKEKSILGLIITQSKEVLDWYSLELFFFASNKGLTHFYDLCYEGKKFWGQKSKCTSITILRFQRHIWNEKCQHTIATSIIQLWNSITKRNVTTIQSPLQLLSKWICKNCKLFLLNYKITNYWIVFKNFDVMFKITCRCTNIVYEEERLVSPCVWIMIMTSTKSP